VQAWQDGSVGTFASGMFAGGRFCPLGAERGSWPVLSRPMGQFRLPLLHKRNQPHGKMGY
jgi:hypothetical protein